MSWHCEDAALNYSALPRVREEWHAVVAERTIDPNNIMNPGKLMLDEAYEQSNGKGEL
jgi:FAD/FMN-containing dehydrogenase